MNVSVIIPTYNEEKVIGQLLDQLVGHYSPEEILICDGGSTDATLAICRDYPVKIVPSPLGRGIQLNAGAHQAIGDLLFFLHADSALEEQTFAEVSRTAEAQNCWGCCRIRFDVDTLFFRYLAWVSNLRAKVLGICFGDQGIFCTRDLFWSVGGFPEIPLMEDLDLSRKLKQVVRPTIIAGQILTSARRFTYGGPLRTLLKMQILQFLFRAGISAERLSLMYRKGFWQGLCNRL